MRPRHLLTEAVCVGLLVFLGSPLSSDAAESSTPSIQNPKPETQNAPPSRVDPKARELLDRTIQALGGDAFLRFKTLTTHGRAFSIEDESTAGFVYFDSAIQYPDKRRFSYGFGRKKPVVLINNGDQAWEIDRMGLTRQTPEQARLWKISSHWSLENLLRLRVNESGMLVQSGGVDFVDNVPTVILDVFDPRQVHVKLYLNKATFLPIEISYRVQNEKTREWDEYADVYGDYRQVQGVETPMHITRFINAERVAETFRDSARYDEAYSLNYFEPTG